MAVLLVIIYLSFISLGLPDSLLGSAWPSMYAGMRVSIESAGIVSMIIAGGTIISSLFSDRVIRRLGTGLVTFLSVAMTAGALMGISFSKSFLPLCLWAVPLGLGAGSVDAALNSFVALHYKARHMSWLHCFWGVGASAGPLILSAQLARGAGWSAGYRTIGLIQLALTAVLLISLPLWKKAQAPAAAQGARQKSPGFLGLTRLPGVKPVLAAFFCYCAMETTIGLWGSSYLVSVRRLPAEAAAQWISLFYLGITAGRFLSGFLSMRLRQRQMVWLGALLIGAGVIVLLLPVSGLPLLAGLFLLGLGCAPIYPSLIHETPENFGSAHAQALMGMQMAAAYVGTTFMPPLFGALAAETGYGIFPYSIGVLLLLMVLMVRRLYSSVSKAQREG